MHLIFRLGILLGITTLLAIAVLSYSEPINSFLQNPIASQILLIILILVDVFGVVSTPWIEHRSDDLRERNKRLIEECISKLQIDPSADDDHILTIESTVMSGRIITGKRPPYYQQMKEHLENYPLWELVQETSELYRNTIKFHANLSKDIREELEKEALAKKVKFSDEENANVISPLADILRDDLEQGRVLREYSVDDGKIQGNVFIRGQQFTVERSKVQILANKMTELSKNTEYGKRAEAIKTDLGRVEKKQSEFIRERDALVEEVTYSSYRNLKRTSWWKRLWKHLRRP